MIVEQEDTEYESCSTVIDCPVLLTERLLLRKPHADDKDELGQLANNRRVASMLASMPHPYGPDDADAFIAMAGRVRAGAIYAVTVAETGAFVGSAGLKPVQDGLELGYWIGEPFWNTGFATEAAHALVDLCFRATGVEVLHATCRAINPASRRVLHKCGFQYAGQGMVQSIVAGRVPVERYKLDKRAWASLKLWGRF